MINMWEDIQARQLEFGYKKEAARTARLIEEAKKEPMAYGYRKEPARGRQRSRMLDFGLVALIFLMYLVVSNASLVHSTISPDLALVLIFVVPFIYAALLAYIQTDLMLTILKGWGTILVLLVGPLLLPIVMLILMLGLSPSLTSIMAGMETVTATILALFTLLPVAAMAIHTIINRIVYGQKDKLSDAERGITRAASLLDLIFVVASFAGIVFLVGSNSRDLMASVEATALLFLILPFASNLYVIGDVMINRNSSYPGIVIVFLPVLYLISAIIGAILGAIGFLVFG
jgi:hypothetical protein